MSGCRRRSRTRPAPASLASTLSAMVAASPPGRGRARGWRGPRREAHRRGPRCRGRRQDERARPRTYDLTGSRSRRAAPRRIAARRPARAGPASAGARREAGRSRSCASARGSAGRLLARRGCVGLRYGWRTDEIGYTGTNLSERASGRDPRRRCISTWIADAARPRGPARTGDARSVLVNPRVGASWAVALTPVHRRATDEVRPLRGAARRCRRDLGEARPHDRHRSRPRRRRLPERRAAGVRGDHAAGRGHDQDVAGPRMSDP